MATGWDHVEDYDRRSGPRSPGLGVPASRRVRVIRPGETPEGAEAREAERDAYDAERGRRVRRRDR